MELRDGFIVGIFNYCDRWCEACAWTSRCRLFADIAKIEGSFDPTLKDVADAPPLLEGVPPPPPKWMQAFLDELNAAANEPASADEPERVRQPIRPQHERLLARADGYLGQVHAWLRARDYFSASDPSDPRAVVGWFHTLIAAKIFRAVTAVREDLPDEHERQADYDGSAKVALLGIDRSHAAWLQMVECGLATGPEVEPFVADLVWLGEHLEMGFPHARAFVRPAFDEAAAVARMWAADDRGV
jgi:hypothetical protein